MRGLFSKSLGAATSTPIVNFGAGRSFIVRNRLTDTALESPNFDARILQLRIALDKLEKGILDAVNEFLSTDLTGRRAESFFRCTAMTIHAPCCLDQPLFRRFVDDNFQLQSVFVIHL
jgi:hypothetical protein